MGWAGLGWALHAYVRATATATATAKVNANVHVNELFLTLSDRVGALYQNLIYVLEYGCKALRASPKRVLISVQIV